MKEKKTKYVMRERDVFAKLNHPFFVKLYFTFQDTERLCILFKISFPDISLLFNINTEWLRPVI